MDVAGFFDSLQKVPGCYEDFVINKVEHKHFLADILPDKKCKLPYYLVTKQCALNDQSAVQESGEESLDGSPLKLQEFDLSQAFVNEQGQAYSTVPVTEARRIISMYTLGLQNPDMKLKERLPMWTLCEDSSHGSTVALGVEVERDGKTHHIDSQMATVKGPVDKSGNFPSIIKRCIVTKGQRQQECKASYSILKPLPTNISGLGEQGSMMVHLSWKNCMSLLQTPPPDARCHVNVVVGNGDIRSPANFMFMELNAVEHLANGIHNNHMEWELRDTEESPSIEHQVKDLIDNTKLSTMTTIASNKTEETVTSPLKSIILVQRKNLDFTEKLWDILKRCGSYEELHRSLSLVLTLLQQGAYQPMLHRANKTQLAGLIRDSFRKKMVMPNLSGLLPLELLLEIGIGKMQRDYLNQMISKELVTAADLEYFMAHDVDLFEQCDRLRKLHIVLELVVMLEQYLMLPSDVLRSAVRKALHQVIKPDAPESEYTIPVSAQCLGNQLRELHPATWSLCLEASGVHCVAYLSPSCPLEHVKMSVDSSEHVEEEKSGESKPKYIMTVVQEHKITI